MENRILVSEYKISIAMQMASMPGSWDEIV